MPYKLVRDKIPRIMAGKGEFPATYFASAVEVHFALKDKLLEEVGEFLEEPILEEAADILEVLLAILGTHGFDVSDLLEARESKRERRGGFEFGVMMEVE